MAPIDEDGKVGVTSDDQLTPRVPPTSPPAATIEYPGPPGYDLSTTTFCWSKLDKILVKLSLANQPYRLPDDSKESEVLKLKNST
jgi:hypothetical protein